MGDTVAAEFLGDECVERLLAGEGPLVSCDGRSGVDWVVVFWGVRIFAGVKAINLARTASKWSRR